MEDAQCNPFEEYGDARIISVGYIVAMICFFTTWIAEFKGKYSMANILLGGHSRGRNPIHHIFYHCRYRF